ncbi:rust resistance kinase Lr10-like [Macadamia integrifolia]|uniref:rust resistance kinase Lr10-like n=1 Tax=Macadamia integrifolia TaxID=60698 RepID=UPI001C4F2F99|nr:rust resistance kinase Lr10-like [Macadamia integrifolia]
MVVKLRRGCLIIAALFIVLQANCEAQKSECSPSSCGNLVNISYPFWLKGHDPPPECRDPRYELSCENNRTVLYLYSGKYYVDSISYRNRTMRVVDSGLQTHNCSSLPLYSLTNLANFSHSTNLEIFGTTDTDPFLYPSSRQLENYIVFLSCESPIVPFTANSSSSAPHFVDTSPCINGSSGSQYSYVFVGDELNYSDVPDSCTIGTMVPIRKLQKAGDHRSFSEIHYEMAMGFELSWYQIDCGSCNETGDFCYADASPNNYTIICNPGCKGGLFHSIFHYTPGQSCFKLNYWFPFYYNVLRPSLIIIGLILSCFLTLRTLLGYLCFPILLIYMLRRRHLSLDANIEEFLQEHNNLLLIQYSYSNIKRMTKNFSDKLGQGGFGSVYKGKLRSGNLVAIKMLATSKGNGQDFINEVATIGRIHHVNVVRLIGFCFEGSKRALVYDFMPNGSLDKYIFNQEQRGNISLSSWEKMYKIALGVAHGIEYLHQGCDMQILHFDIKPHNVLLDEDFTPKISDFGLAKLYPVVDNTVSLTAARGTIGYIAPELFYKSMGGVSYKADVYSFGMLLMEMAGRKKYVNPYADNSSQIYFPSWIYDKLNQGEDMEMEDASEDDKKIARKIIIVALYCIQMKPVDRPSMSKVIEMLESPTELLQMPPKPFLASLERVEEDHIIMESSPNSESSSYNSLSYNSMI